ncbi:uncharacterized protein L3040_006311 [Drepanopeziza brunnea f. sp. 'multigermtubi']|uniref:uncharacterized protein n=1 Tax=Drepanopeziza brunnea f. sp. 'multigermtubi' TaxID=698441 RepID=UPI0023912184|nr:hypothetical protein L3040_006311 [Drepanopeziza brunnea f. sp. 'multigermtubi']
MCLFSAPAKKHHRRSYVEEVYVAPRPVSRHSHRSHHAHHHHPGGGPGRSSYTSVTRTSTHRPVSRSREYVATGPRVSQSSYRQHGRAPVIVEQRRSTRSYR